MGDFIMDLVQIKIKKDSNIVSYISLIRKFDSSISITDIKRNIANNDFVMEFDLEYYDALEDIEDVYKRQYTYSIPSEYWMSQI